MILAMNVYVYQPLKRCEELKNPDSDAKNKNKTCEK